MHRAGWRVLFAGVLLGGVATAQSPFGDSLGDVARANQAKQQEKEAAGAKAKVITNQDLPSAPSGIAESSEPMTTVSGVKRPVEGDAGQRSNQRLLAEQRSGEQWKTRIENQEERISDLRARINRANESMRAAVGTAQYETPVSRYQSVQMRRVARMQEMMELQQRRLEMMQDAARLTGMGH